MKVYGTSDDLVELEGSKYQENEIGCYGSDVIIAFDDGAVIRVSYGKPEGAIWEITLLKRGTAGNAVFICYDEDDEIYSDIFETDAEVCSHWVIDRGTEPPKEAFVPAKDEYRQGVEYVIYELMKELDVPGSNEIRKLPSADDICAAAAEKIREYLMCSKETPQHPDEEEDILACQRCGSGEYLYNEDGNKNNYCGQCGQKLVWQQ
jgi:hypothetical protein